MKKKSVFSSYIDDFEIDTRHMTDAEVGCYLRLLLAQVRNGKLPDNESRLKRFSDSFNTSWIIVKEKFVKGVDGGLVNERMVELVRDKADAVETSEKDMTNNRSSTDEHLCIGMRNTNTIKSGISGENENPILLKMIDLWKNEMPGYPVVLKKDLPALLEILMFICERNRVVANIGNFPPDDTALLLCVWKMWCFHLKGRGCNHSLDTIAKFKLQQIYQEVRQYWSPENYYLFYS